MDAGSEPDLTTARLHISAIEAADLPGILAVAQSNPEFLATHEGSGGEAGQFASDMLERDLAVAWMDPLRHPLAVRLAASGDVIGWADVLDRHERDAVPWIGLLEIHAGWQRQGFGSECAQALTLWYRDAGQTRIRLGVDTVNPGALAFWQHLGAQPVDERDRPSPQGHLIVRILEFDLAHP